MQEYSGFGKKRILVVDDDPQQLDVVRKFLEPAYFVGTVSYSKFALEYIRQYHTDLILLDVMMPIMDGFQTLRAIRNLEEGINIPIIFLTGKNSREIVLDSISLGVDGYLIKPVSKETLISKINSVLEAQNNMLHKKTVLAIDDDVTYLKIINSALKDAFNVVMINSSKLAMEYLTSHKPDIILLDYQMPLYSGGAMLGYIRKLPDLSDLPVIMLTGINDKNVVMECMQDKPDKFLLKPVGKLDLMKAIVSVLSSHGQHIDTGIK